MSKALELGEELFSRTSGEFLDRKSLKIVDSLLLEEDEDAQRVFGNDPGHSFIPIEEVADYGTFEYPEIFGLTLEDENEIVVADETFKKNTLVSPMLIEDEKHFGRIICAFADAKTGCIILLREKNCSIVKNDYFDQEVCTDDDIILPFQGKMSVKDWHSWRHRKGEQHKPRRNNLKTLPVNKIQRMNRGTLRTVIGKDLNA